MKKLLTNLETLTLCMILCASFISCATNDMPKDIWESATYTENQEFGSGENTITVEVLAEEKSVEFTVYTDKETLGDALQEHELISGDQGAYGLYVKVVNGILADYNTTKSYWGINKNGESLITGVDSENIEDGASYEFIYTKN